MVERTATAVARAKMNRAELADALGGLMSDTHVMAAEAVKPVPCSSDTPHQQSPQKSCRGPNELAPTNEATLTSLKEPIVPEETAGSDERQRPVPDAAPSSPLDDPPQVCPEPVPGRAIAGARLDATGKPTAETASPDDPLRRTGGAVRDSTDETNDSMTSGSRSELLPLSAPPNDARTEDNNETTRGAGALPIMWGVAQAPGARLITAA